jgi:hypothetical protein
MGKEIIMLQVEVDKEQLDKIKDAEYLRFDDKVFVSKERAVQLFNKWEGKETTNGLGNCNIPPVRKRGFIQSVGAIEFVVLCICALFILLIFLAMFF